MRAQFLAPRVNFHGNLLWKKSELSGREALLAASLAAISQRGYWASPFPDGDGVVFSCDDKLRTDDLIYADFAGAFPWLDVVAGDSGDGNIELAKVDGDRDIACTVMVPVLKVKIEDSFDLGKFRLVCARVFDPAPHARLSRYEGEYIQFETTLKYGDLLRVDRSIDFNDGVIKQCLAQAEHAMDVIRFQFSSFARPRFTPNPAGQLDDGMYSVDVIPHGTFLKPMELHGIALPMGASNNWLGPELEDADVKGRFLLIEILNGRSDAISNSIKTVLRSCRQSFYTLGDESRFLNLIFALDGFVEPKKDWVGWKHRTYVAAVISGGEVKRFEVVLEQYDLLYSEIRNPLVHGGKDFYQLDFDPAEACQHIYGYIQEVIAFAEIEAVGEVSEFHDLAIGWLQTAPFMASYAKVIANVCAKRGQSVKSLSWT
jgi:hypothetical protein